VVCAHGQRNKFSYLFTARQRDVSGISGVVSAQFQSGSDGGGLEGFYGRKWSSKTEFERDLADYSKDTYQVFATLDSRTVSKRDLVAVLGTFPDDCDSVVNNSAVDRDVEVNAGHSGAVEDDDVNRQTDRQ